MVEVLYVPPTPEPEFGPSMVEPCHNLSIAEILADYSRGIVHTSRPPFYDEGEDIPDNLDDIEDISDIYIAKPTQKPADSAGPKGDPPASSEQKDEGATKEATED